MLQHERNRSRSGIQLFGLRLTSLRFLPVLLLLLTGLCFAPGSDALAADDPPPPSFTGTIGGSVIDEDGQPVGGVRVHIPQSGHESVTGRDGRFEISDVPAGEWRVEAHLSGFSVGVAEGVIVTVGSTAEITIQLGRVEVPLKEIVVTSTASILREDPVSAVSLDREEIMTMPHFGDDLYRAITALPGAASGDISSRFSVRGGLHDEILVLLDGQELFEPFHLKDFQGVFSILDPQVIGGVDLTPGGFPADFGDRMTALLEMNSTEPVENLHSIGISFTNAWGFTSGTWGEGKGSWLGSLRRGYLDVILGMASDGDDDDPPDPKYWDGFFKLAYNLNQEHRLALNVLAADDSLVFEEEDSAEEYSEAETGYGSRYVWLDHQWIVGARTFVDTTLSLGQVTTDRYILYVDPEEGIDLNDDRDLNLLSLRQGWQFELSGRQYLRWGFEARRYDATYDYLNTFQVQDPIDDPRFEPGTGVTSFNEDYTAEQYALYLADRFRLGRSFTAELGVRYDAQSLTEDSDLSPRVNLVYDLGAGGLVRAGYGHYYQTMRPHELNVPFGDFEFYRSQLAEQWTAGYDADLLHKIHLRIDAYWRQVADPRPRYETIFDPFHPAPEVATGLVRLEPESVKARGVELFLGSRGAGPFSWWLSYTISSIEDELDGEFVPRYIDQPHAFTVSGSWRPNEKWTLTGLWTWHSGWPTTVVSAELVDTLDGSGELAYTVGPFYGERLDDYHRLDVRISRATPIRIGRLIFFIDIMNIYNRENPRGINITDPEYIEQADGTVDVVFETENWLGIIPSFGVNWEF